MHIVCVCCVCEGERYFQKVNLLEVIVFVAARLFTFCVCARTHVHALACACVCFRGGEIFRKWTCLELFRLLQSTLCTLSVSEGQRFSEGEHARSYFPYFSHSAFHIQSVFLSVCVDVFTWVSSVKLCLFVYISYQALMSYVHCSQYWNCYNKKTRKVRRRKISHVLCGHYADEILSLTDFYPGLSV